MYRFEADDPIWGPGISRSANELMEVCLVASTVTLHGYRYRIWDA